MVHPVPLKHVAIEPFFQQLIRDVKERGYQFPTELKDHNSPIRSLSMAVGEIHAKQFPAPKVVPFPLQQGYFSPEQSL